MRWLADESVRVRLLGVDPVPWLMSTGGPLAAWVTLTAVLGTAEDDSAAEAARAGAREDPQVCELLSRLGDWEVATPLSGHESPAFAPHLLGLLADMGVREQDDPRVGRILDAMLRHQDPEGRLCSLAVWKRAPAAVWAALPCDAFPILEVLLRLRPDGGPALRRAASRALNDLTETAQGPGWLCRPDPALGFRGPGRKADVCPQATVQALRALSYLPRSQRPPALASAVRTLLGVWRQRGSEHPYMFGHGRRFKRTKWPTTWYHASTVLDAVGRYPEVWRSPTDAEDVRSVAELAACVVAYNVDRATGLVTPRSCYKGFETFGFGQKKRPSAFATARTLATLARVGDLTDLIAEVDVLSLASSKGGSGTPLAP